MKKIKTLFLLALLLGMTNVHAEDVLTVENVTLPQNGEMALEIKAQLETNFTQFQLEIVLDDGLGMKLNKSNRPWGELGDAESTDHTVSSSTPAPHTFRYIISSMTQTTLPDSEVLLRVKLVPDGSPEVGTVLNGTITSIVFNEYTGSGNVGHNFDDVPFTVTIGEPVDNRTLLDENATAAPTAATGVDVRVKRTIKAGEWSTICLPFAMSEQQTKEAFGENVQLADFAGCVSTYDETEENIIALTINFDNVSDIEANHPYIIKTEADIAEFTADGVDIVEAGEGELTVNRDELEYTYKVGKKTYTGYMYNSFVGTYEAQTEVPENALFISGSQFWYSKGLTKMKAFRGYFEFYDVLSSAESDEGATRRISMAFTKDDEVSAVQSVAVSQQQPQQQPQQVYDLQGRLVKPSSLNADEDARAPKPSALKKGVYVRDGRKFIIK